MRLRSESKKVAMPQALTIPQLARTQAEPLLATVGNTPLLRLRRLAARHGVPERVEIWLKAEWTNPGGSIKDRPALGIVLATASSRKMVYSRLPTRSAP